MKRRHFFIGSTAMLLCQGAVDCSISWEEQNAQRAAEEAPQRTSDVKRSRRSSGPSDIKTLSKILQQAGQPLTESQIEYLLTLNDGPEFSEKMKEVLTERQLGVLNENTRRRRRR